ncbi:MAG: DUF998 domain-containing protein [Candidatus Helarchaeota archaeon]|nr:DUF998 domain-containing protein [Candidatus Helarchaeota archaeon]
MEKLKEVFQGMLSKKSLTHYYLPFMIGSFLFFLLIARLLYPYIPIYPYNWTTSMISRLGWPEENPIGFVFFSLSFILLGILTLPIVQYLYRKYSKINEFYAKLIVFFFFAYSIASILIGLIPNFYEPNIFKLIHVINAGFIFLGFFLMSFFSAILMLKNVLSKGKAATFSKKLLVIYISILIYCLICGLLWVILAPTNRSGRFFPNPITPFYFSAPFYEWQAFMAFSFLLPIQCIILPDELE